MDHLHFGHRHPLWHSLVALVLFLLWSASSLAQHHQVQGQWPSSITISGTPPATVAAGQNYSFIPTVDNPQSRRLVFTIAQMPSWASFDSSTGQLSGTPSSADVGTYSGIVITVSTSWRTTQLPAFAIQVLAGTALPPPPPPAAPTISGKPATSVIAGNAYSFTPTATGPSGTTLTFSAQNLPSWASFNSATGALSGTPTVVGTTSGIIISVSDGPQSASLAPFSITVTSASPPPPPPAPTISGTPATSVAAANAYSFTPSASGPSGMTLSFSVQNKPSWANFSIASGQLSGTPTTSNVGTYAGIVVSVSDGQASAALPAFTIAVTTPPLPPTGSATLNWAAPTSNTDGSALTDLAGFEIFYGTSASALNQSVQVAGAGQTTYTLSNLAAGTWYFGVTAYTTAGTQSAMSSVASLAVQ